MAKQSSLQEYYKKRDFKKTPEPKGAVHPSAEGHLFVIQKHDATRLHYDFRIELNGTLKSWAVPKGPSLDPAEKRLAVHVEDHPIDYGSFEGIIPEGEYGGGTVMLWDRGWWEPVEDPEKGYQKGRLKFRLHGEKLQGGFTLVQMKNRNEGKDWLLIKERDEIARPQNEYDITDELNTSVKTGRSLEEIAQDQDRVWTDEGEVVGKQVEEKLKKRAGKAQLKQTLPAKPDASRLPGAKKAEQPDFIPPELATLVKAVPEGDNWVHEVKFDGYRILAVVKENSPRLVSRNNNDWSYKFKSIVKAVEELHLGECILDGELVVLDKNGISNFQALQNTMKEGAKNPLYYYVFDIPYYHGYSLTAVPLETRKQFLQEVLNAKASDVIRYSEHIVGQGGLVYENACKLHLEGVISKRADSPYEQKRSRAWLKIKCGRRQEFVIAGFTDPSGGRSFFGALLLAYYRDDQLLYCGRVGTGFNEKSLKDLHKRLLPLEVQKPFVVNPPRGSEARGVHWVKPEMVCEVAFAEWTTDNQLRHPSFQGLREDKKATEVVREEEQAQHDESNEDTEPAKDNPSMANEREEMPPRKSASSKRGSKEADPVVGGVRISNPDRVLYPEQGVTKLQMAQYYDAVADWVLPYITRRPISIVRCPQGVGEKCFYQRHVNETLPNPIRGVPIVTGEGEKSYIVIDDRVGLISLVQLGVLEIHPWACRENDIEHPDYITFDLDPAPDVQWAAVIEACDELKQRLGEAGMQSFIKTSGGKGIHVVVPLAPKLSWDEAREFSKQISETMVKENPGKYVATVTKAKRHGKILIDYFRNTRTATSVSAYSTRARHGAPVSAPISWDELAKVAPDAFTIENVPGRLAKMKKDPWQEFFKLKQVPKM